MESRVVDRNRPQRSTAWVLDLEIVCESVDYRVDRPHCESPRMPHCISVAGAAAVSALLPPPPAPADLSDQIGATFGFAFVAMILLVSSCSLWAGLCVSSTPV